MSYGVASALQAAVFQHLSTDSDIITLVGSHVYDAVPSGAVPSTYVSLGPEIAVERSDKTGRGAEHRFEVSVVTDASGFSAAKDVAVAINDALQDAALGLSRGTLVSLTFRRATAKRSDDGSLRRIDLTFHARVEDN